MATKPKSEYCSAPRDTIDVTKLKMTAFLMMESRELPFRDPLKAESSEDDSDYEDLGEWYDKESPKYKPKVLPKDGKTWQEAQDEQDALDAISAEDLS